MLAYLIDAFSGRGAPFMWLITAILAYGLAVFLERSWVLFAKARFPVERVRVALAQGELERAVEEAGKAPVADVLRAGLAAGDAEGAWEAMSATSVDVEASLHRRISYLSMIGNVSTMVGLLGNVTGVILAFGSLGSAAVDERAVRLSEGVATAMAATAYGLAVAIPALVAHTWLEGAARARMAQVEALAGLFSAALRKRASPASGGSAA
jgi:biopolymer transport protein ExbB